MTGKTGGKTGGKAGGADGKSQKSHSAKAGLQVRSIIPCSLDERHQNHAFFNPQTLRITFYHAITINTPLSAKNALFPMRPIPLISLAVPLWSRKALPEVANTKQDARRRQSSRVRDRRTGVPDRRSTRASRQRCQGSESKAHHATPFATGYPR